MHSQLTTVKSYRMIKTAWVYKVELKTAIPLTERIKNGMTEVFGLNKAIQNRSIIKDHLIFKDRQYQKHKVEYKKIVLYKCDLIKAVYSYSLPQQ